MAAVLSRIFRSKRKFGISGLSSSRTHVELVKCFSGAPSSEADTEDKDEDEVVSRENTKDTRKVPHDPDEFKPLLLYPLSETKTKKERKKVKEELPRTLLMTPDQDWTNVWPGPRTFHPATVPLPLHQGCNKSGPPPSKIANTELMKIPNFLHLTPPAIEKHCNVLKKFCTKWPENLDTEEKIEKHFPVEIITSDYCHSSPSIRDPNSRIVSLKIKLDNLILNKHSKDKFLRLVGERYDPSTGYVTITTDSCPIKKQNYDYAHYLLTAVYFESHKFEEWEKEKSDADMEEYIFSERQSARNVKQLFDYNKREMPDVKDLGKLVEDWQNKGDDRNVIQNYKKTVLKLLSLPPLEA